MAYVFTEKSNEWREYSNPLRGVTIEGVAAKIEIGERGSFADLQWFYQAMERSDALIATVVQRRRAALLSCSWDVKEEAFPSDPGLAREQAAFLRDRYDAIDNLKEAVAFLASAVFRGYAHVEKHYGEGGEIFRLEPVEQWFWCREGMFGEWTYNREARSGVEKGEKVKRENFVIVEAPFAMDRILSVQFVRRNLALRDWSSFLDVYGIPSFFFIGPPNLSEEKEQAYYNIACSLLKDQRGYLPNGTDVKYVDGGAGRFTTRGLSRQQITLSGRAASHHADRERERHAGRICAPAGVRPGGEGRCCDGVRGAAAGFRQAAPGCGVPRLACGGRIRADDAGRGRARVDDLHAAAAGAAGRGCDGT